MKATLGGAAIDYVVEGDGPAVVFLHAFPLGKSMWDDQARALRESHRTLRFDARGFGGTAPDDVPLTMDRVADDAAALLGLLGMETAVVVGCSMGGYAAFAFARRHPERLTGLVLQDTRASADTEEGRASRATLAERVRKEGAGAAAEAFLPRLVGETTHRERRELVADLRARILTTSPEGIAQALLGLGAREDSRATLARIRVPTLVVVGEEDVITPPADAQEIASGIEGSRLVVIPKAGHLANLESPAAYNETLLGFLGALP